MPIARESLLLSSIFVSISFSGQTQVPVQPWTYRSPLGTLELLVDPSQRSGAGPARCRMSRYGELVWEHEITITFLDALVEEDGSVAAYGYSEGVRRSGELVVAVLAPNGSLRAEERHPRVGPRFCGGSPLPRVGDMRRCADGFALEVLGVSQDQYDWWVYDRATCRKSLDQHLAPDTSELTTGLGASSTSEGEQGGVTPLLEMTPLGRVLFPWPVPLYVHDEANPRPELKNRGPHEVHVDRAGRIWISELSTRMVHVFGSTGAPLFDRVPDPDTFRPYRPAEWLSVRDDGILFMCADGAVEAIGWPGERGSRIPVERSLPPRWEFLPGSNDRWEVSPLGSVEFVDDEDGVSWRTERGPNGRWLEALWNSAVDVDGTLAVFDEPRQGSRATSAWVHLFAKEGQPIRSIRVPWQEVALPGRPLAIHRGFLALLEEREVLFLGASEAVLGRAPLPEEAQGGRFLSFSPSGNELWVFSRSRVEMWRFEIPPSLRG